MSRPTVYCIVEGQTENSVLKKLVAEHLAQRGVDFHAPIVQTRSGRGGVKYLHRRHLIRDIQRFLRDRRAPYVTTFFDYYGFPVGEEKGWGFVTEAKDQAKSHGLQHAVARIEREIARLSTEGLDIPETMGRCFPYLQLHELEALFFAEPAKLADTLEKPGLKRLFEQAVSDCGGCEAINDRPQTAPSNRIQMAAPHYIKGRSAAAHAPILASQLDLATVRQQCPRFHAWLQRLEALSLLGSYRP